MDILDNHVSVTDIFRVEMTDHYGLIPGTEIWRAHIEFDAKDNQFIIGSYQEHQMALLQLIDQFEETIQDKTDTENHLALRLAIRKDIIARVAERLVPLIKRKYFPEVIIYSHQKRMQIEEKRLLECPIVMADSEMLTQWLLSQLMRGLQAPGQKSVIKANFGAAEIAIHIEGSLMFDMYLYKKELIRSQFEKESEEFPFDKM